MTDEQFASIMGVLGQIRDALTVVEVELSDECQHPEEKRIDFRSIGEAEHWICSDCKYEHRLIGN